MLPFGDEVLLQRVVRVLRDVVDPIVVVAAEGQELPALPNDVLIARDDREYLGPLNGLAMGLEALAGRAAVAYLTACDVPFLKPTFVQRVLDSLGEHDVAIPDVGGYRHPLAAAYRLAVLPTVRALIDENRLRPVYVADQCRTIVLKATDFANVDPELASLRNVNTPDEYEAARADLRILG